MSANAQTQTASEVRDPALADAGRRRIEWSFQSMPVLQSIRKQFIKNQPLGGLRISACLHVTAETANLMMVLRDGGAQVVLCSSNPLSTQDDVAAALSRDLGMTVFAIRGEEGSALEAHLNAAAGHRPNLTMDAGADLVHLLHTKRKDLLPEMIGGTEETTSGVVRLRAMAREGALDYPIVAVNDAHTKHLFDNRYGTGQSTVDGIIRAANILLAGMTVVVAGFGWCGRGVAMRARGLGANVLITEVDPIKALEAIMDGYRVMSMQDAASIGDVFVTVTGNKNVIGREHFEKFRNNVILCNSGHFKVEIDVQTLARMASSRRETRELVEEFKMADGRRIYVLGEGRPINFAAGEGHPASVMDISFANQALAAEFIAKNRGKLEKKVYSVPEDLDRQVAKIKLEAMGVKIDRLTPDQEHYQASWSEA